MTGSRFYVGCVLGGFGAAAAIIVAVFTTGATFSQRCAHAYPDDAPRAMVCVDHLSHGEAP